MKPGNAEVTGARRETGAGTTRGDRRVVSQWLRWRVVLDRILAAIASVVLAPVVAVLSVIIRRHDDGPGLVRVERVGVGGRTFKMWKLRTMTVGRASGLADGPTLTLGADDQRITDIGRRLRSYHLDEVPQLWNVVAGDMALLGPRPEDPEFVDLDDPLWQEILVVPPGIAGPTQVIVSDWERGVIASCPDGSAYRSTVLPVKLAIDRWYLGAASPSTDALVGVTLLRRLLPYTESWTLKQRVMRDVPAAAPAYAFLRATESARRSSRWASRADSTGIVKSITGRVAAMLDRRVDRRFFSEVVLPEPVAGTAPWVIDQHVLPASPDLHFAESAPHAGG